MSASPARPRPGPSSDDPVAAAHTAALRLLAVRARSRAEVDQRLRRKGFAPAAIADALDRLERSGLLDDAAFAADLAQLRSARGVASGQVRRELRARGVDADAARAASLAASPPEQEAERCHDLAVAWLGRHPGLAPEVATRRLAGYLARRGYPGGLVARTLSATIGVERSFEAE